MATEDPAALTLALYRAMTAFDRAEAAALAPHGLTVSQLNILTVLHQADRVALAGLLERLRRSVESGGDDEVTRVAG